MLPFIDDVDEIANPGSRKTPTVGDRFSSRHLYFTKKGERLTKDNVRSIRPGLGLPPVRLWDVLGRTASRDLARGEPLANDMVAD